jgi:chromosome segregation ATPase
MNYNHLPSLVQDLEADVAGKERFITRLEDELEQAIHVINGLNAAIEEALITVEKWKRECHQLQARKKFYKAEFLRLRQAAGQ